MTWSFGFEILTLDPHTPRVSFTNDTLGNIYEPLVRMNDKLGIELALALPQDKPSPTLWTAAAPAAWTRPTACSACSAPTR